MTISRRIEKLEAAEPENIPSYRLMFKNEGEPDPVIDPPLKPNERVMLVNFVPPGWKPNHD